MHFNDEEDIYGKENYVNIKCEENISKIELCDVTLACLDEKIQTHTVIFQDNDLELSDVTVENQDDDVTSVENNSEQIKNVKEKKKSDVEVLENFDANFDFKILFPCDKCPKIYSLKNDLEDHTRIHVERKFYSCSQCNKTFWQQSEIKVHKRNQFKIIFPKKCGQEGRLMLRKQKQNFIFQVF